MWREFIKGWNIIAKQNNGEIPMARRRKKYRKGSDEVKYVQYDESIRVAYCIHESSDSYESSNVFTSHTTRTCRLMYSRVARPLPLTRETNSFSPHNIEP